MSRVDPALFASIDAGPRIISFRNKLTHEYRTTDHVLVWGVIVGSLPGLREQCGGLIQGGRVTLENAYGWLLYPCIKCQ